MIERRSRRTSIEDAAEAVFKPAPKSGAPARSAGHSGAVPGAIPAAREMVSIRIDQDVLAHFQEDGPGWQDRLNAALRKAIGLD